MKAVNIHAAATAEAEEAARYYDTQRIGLGTEFEREIQATVGAIQRMPTAFAAFGSKGMRKAFLNRFPFTIFFMELPEEIWIAAIAHQKRRPGYWHQRAPAN